LIGAHIFELLTFSVVAKAISNRCQLLVRKLGEKRIGHNVRGIICRDQAPLNFVRAGWKAEG